MKWQATSQADAQRLLAKTIGCRHAGEGLRIAAIAECLRAASSLRSAPLDGGGVWEPAASLSLTSMVRRRLSPIWPDIADDDELRPGVMTILNSLGDVGDLVRVEGNKWLTSPARAIKAADGTAVLIGGGPTQAFPNQVVLKFTGRVRLVDAASCEGWADIWDAEEWINAPMTGLNTWSDSLLAEAESRLTWAPTNMSEVSVYSFRKWIPLEGMPDAKGLLLARCYIGPMLSYFMGEFSRGRLSKLAHITSQEARRLRFHLDRIAGCPIRVQTETSNGFTRLQLPRPLPTEEAKTLLLGWQIPTPASAHPGATSHVIPIEMLPIVRCALEGLGVILN